MSKSVSEWVNKLAPLVAVFVVVLTVFLGVKVYDVFNGTSNDYPREISAEGRAKAYIVPDLARVELGVYAEGADSKSVIDQADATMKKIVESVKALGVEAGDIETSQYNLNPRFNYAEGRGSYQDGFTLNQSVIVKIRDFEKVSGVLTAAGDAGVTNIGNVNFVVEDRDAALETAREEAIKKAQAKMAQIAKQSGIHVKKLRGYYEYVESNPYSPDPYYVDRGMGGGGGASAYVEAPEQEVTLIVTMTYRVR